MDKIFLYFKVAVIVIVVIGGAICGIKAWNKMSAKERKEKILAWLLQAMLVAEQQFGNGTGKLKLSAVYAGFVQTFPYFADMITFETFSQYVDEVKPQMDHLLENNDAIAEIVAGVKVNESAAG